MTAEYVFVAEFPDEVEALKPTIEALRTGEAESSLLAVGCWPEAYEAFAKLDVRTNNTIPYLPKSSHERVFLAAADFAWGWYKGLEGCLCYEGQSLPESVVYHISQVFTHLFLNVELLKNIITLERPKKLWVVAAPTPLIDSVLIGRQERYMAVLAQSVACQIPVELEVVPYPAELSPSGESHGSESPWRRRLEEGQQAFRHLFRHPSPFLARGLLALPGVAAAVQRKMLARYSSRRKRLVFWEGLSMRRRLYEALRRDRSYGVVGLTASAGAPPLGEAFLPTLCSLDFATKEIESKVEETREGLLKAWEALSSDAGFTSRFRYQGMDFWPALRPRLEFFFTRYFPASVRQYECIREFVRQFDPHLLVAGQIPGEYRAWVHKAFHDSGKPTLVIPEGHDVSVIGIGGGEKWARLLHGKRATIWPLHASRMAARGVSCKEWYEERGIEPERIRVTGVPDWGDGAAISPEVRSRRCRRLGLDPGKTIIVYTASVSERAGVRAYSEETIYEILEATRDVIEELGANPEYALVVKLHPGSRYEELFHRMARPFPLVKVLGEDVDFRHIVPVCDILISHMASSTALEALLHDKDVIIYNPTGRENVNSPLCMQVDDPEANYFVLVSERRSLAPTIERLRADRELRQKLAEKRLSLDPLLLHNRDGKSLGRVMGLIEEMMAASADNGLPVERCHRA